MVDDVRRQGELVGEWSAGARARSGALVLAGALLLITFLGGCSRPPAAAERADAARVGPVDPRLATDPVADDPDDPAIWLHPTDPSRSLIFGTNKVAAPSGAVVAFGLDGRIRQTIAGIDRPNNADVEYGVRLGDVTSDILVLTERLKHQLRLFRVNPDDGRLTDLGAVPVLEGQKGEAGEPMGVAIYRRPSDQAIFAIVAPKTGPAADYLWQYHLVGDARAGVTGRLVRRFGTFSGLGPVPGEAGEIEAVVVDDELGFVYYADERFGIRKWHADPAHADAATELAVFGRSGYRGDREGLALVTRPGGVGYLVSSDQMPGASTLKVYPREGEPGAPHDHTRRAFDVPTPADDTDGVDAVGRTLPGFPDGLVVMMNSAPRNFLLFSWADLTSRRAGR